MLRPDIQLTAGGISHEKVQTADAWHIADRKREVQTARRGRMTGIFEMLSLLAGAALLLIGIRILGSGLLALSGQRARRLLRYSADSPVRGFLLGFTVTAVIQSANATVLLTAELCAGGLLAAENTAGILLGASVGTTVTAQLFRMLGVRSGVEYAVLLVPAAAVAGAVLCVRKRTAPIGRVLLGFSLLLLGMMGMSDATREGTASVWLSRLLCRSVGGPVRSLTAGLTMGLCLQSSSACVAVLQALSPAGFLTGRAVYALLIGICFGSSVVTGLLCRAAGPRGRRVGTMYICLHLLAAAFLTAILPAAHVLGLTEPFWNSPMSSGSIANLHMLCRLVSSLSLLPLSGVARRAFEAPVKAY